ncbi:hypothetical protein SOVF_126840 [Spinacia oleracea]|uniref:Uncharacterized protein n=1 Tax=Spinacia oleracea TaxID=3562 RepID=A0A9R0JXI5_SPIOL|nr:uncharacterized protein LOC110789813 [Spinacia oleracea]KNA12340.1 hypothetical protein SOVF_126840 [Spinacia oleracea]
MQRKRPLNRINKNKNIRKKNRISSINLRKIIPDIVDYLKSDSYFYSHIISSSSPSHHSAPYDVFLSSTDTGEPILANKERAVEKLEEYLKSDTYLYTPLEGTQHRDSFAVKTVIPPPREEELQFMRVTSTVSSEKIAWQAKKVAEKSVLKKRGDQVSNGYPHDASVVFPKTPGLQEVNKQAARRSSRLSTISG